LGTEITLDVAGVFITYSKSDRGFDHGSLFQEADRQAIESEYIDYVWHKTEGEDPTPSEMAFVRTLKNVVSRLELLGFNLRYVRQEYDAIAELSAEDSDVFQDDDDCDLPVALMDFDEFCNFIKAYPLESLGATFSANTDNAGERRIRSRFNESQLRRIPFFQSRSVDVFSERHFFVNVINILHPYSVLRLLGEAKANENATVVWQYGPLVEAGWATEPEFVPNARRVERFLIVTEGSSDVHILKHAIKLLRPEIADFFQFIDVSESHPFSGTGNLIKFAQGLIKIDVQNQMVFVFDNDAEGLDAYRRLTQHVLPENMSAIILPELDAFRQFTTQGPDGIHQSDINRRAAAIECYLDLDFGSQSQAKVLWTNYKKDLGAYHGALEFKDTYTRMFLKQTSESISCGEYKVCKILAVLELLVSACTEIAFRQKNMTQMRRGSSMLL
jgi:hypothetical protein